MMVALNNQTADDIRTLLADWLGMDGLWQSLEPTDATRALELFERFGTQPDPTIDASDLVVRTIRTVERLTRIIGD